jgi:DNA-binding protein Fis
MKMAITLRDFATIELIFDIDETRAILGFFFASKAAVVGSMVVSDQVRSFAQALLLEAVDASYSLGYVEALTSSVSRPNATLTKMLKKFGKKALKHWFKHARQKDLSDIKIYEVVRKDIEWSFGRVFLMHADGIAMHTPVKMGFVAAKPARNAGVVWG